MFLFAIRTSNGSMSKEFSHREAFHRHLANIYNIKERHSLEAKEKYLERCKEIKSYAYSREEKELRKHLADLLKEKDHLQHEGSCLDKETLKAIEQELQLEQAQQEQHDNEVTARLIQRSPDCIRKIRRGSGHISRTDYHSMQAKSNSQMKSWHATKVHENKHGNSSMKLPNISGNRRHSIADPNQMTHHTRKLAWNERPPSSKMNSHQHKSRHQVAWSPTKSHSRVVRGKSSVASNTPQVTVLGPGGSDLSLHDIETIIKAEDIHHPAPPSSGHHHYGNSSTHSIGSHHPLQHNKRTIDRESLQHYYDLVAENERMLREDNSDFETPADAHCPLGTLKRSNKRKLLALEALLMQLPSFKEKPAELDPIKSLNCRYLRLSKQNVTDLEDVLVSNGRDPGVHAHMDEQRVLDYFDTHQLQVPNNNKRITLEI